MELFSKFCMWFVTRETILPRISFSEYRLEKYLKRQDVTQTENYVEVSKALRPFFDDIERLASKKIWRNLGP